MIHGKDLILTINSEYAQNVALAASKSCEVEVNTDFIEVASPTDGAWKQYVPTYLSWGLSASSLLAYPETYNTLFAYQTNKTKLTVRFFDPDLGIYYKGNTYISNLRNTATVGSLVKISLNFQPTGPLTPATVNTISCAEEQVGKTIIWANGAPAMLANEDGKSLKYTELTLTTVRTCIKTTHAKTIVFKESATSVITKIYQGVSMSELLSTAVLVDGVGGKSVIVDSGTYTILINGENQSTPDGTYVSTF